MSEPTKKRKAKAIARAKAWNLANKERRREWVKRYVESNRERLRREKAEYYQLNRERFLAAAKSRLIARSEGQKAARREYARAWKKQNPRDKEKIAREWRSWYERNRPYMRARDRKRFAQQLLAMPHWACEKAILAFYDEARRLTAQTGIAHAVDHIVPLVSKRVCGLHVEHNLRVTTKSENSAKGNRWWPDMSEAA